MADVLEGQTNVVGLSLVAKVSGNPIVAGTVNFYLYAYDGTHAGKWYKGAAGGSWEATEQIAGAGVHIVDGQWKVAPPGGAWTADVRYRLYAKESGNLHIPVGTDLRCVAQGDHAAILAIKAGTDLITAGQTRRMSPVSERGDHVDLYQGVNHSVATGMQIDFDTTGTWGFPAGSTVAFLAKHIGGTHTVTLVGTRLTSPSLKARFEATPAQIADMVAGIENYRFEAIATHPDGTKEVLAEGFAQMVKGAANW